MKDIAEALALMIAAILDAVLRVGRWLRDLVNPPSPADAWDAATADLQAAERRVAAEAEAEPVEVMEPLGSLARRFIMGDESANIWCLPLKQQAFIVAARKAGVRLGAMDDETLEYHVTGRAVAMRLVPLLDPQKLDAVRRQFVRRPDDSAADFEHADAYRMTPGW